MDGPRPGSSLHPGRGSEEHRRLHPVVADAVVVVDGCGDDVLESLRRLPDLDLVQLLPNLFSPC